MNSTLMRTTALDAVLLPAATCAPASLVVAVETWLSQETSALTQAVYSTSAAVAAHAAVVGHVAAPAAAHAAAPAIALATGAVKPFAVRNRIDAFRSDMTAPPSRGTPV